MKEIFISYSHSDFKKMKSLKKIIDKSGTDLRYIVVADEKKPLITLAEKVQSGLSQSDFLVPIITSNSIYNQWVNQEIGFAIAKGIKIIPIVASNVFKDLKGFIHPQVDCPFQFEISDKSTKENANFRKICNELVQFINPDYQQTLVSRLANSVVKEGDHYMTHVHFKGKLNHGFFDNFVQHSSSDFYRWNPDKQTFPSIPGKNSSTFPGTLKGTIDTKTYYSHSTKGWPKGMYKIHVRVYDHLVPGETSRAMIAENVHELKII